MAGQGWGILVFIGLVWLDGSLTSAISTWATSNPGGQAFPYSLADGSWLFLILAAFFNLLFIILNLIFFRYYYPPQGLAQESDKKGKAAGVSAGAGAGEELNARRYRRSCYFLISFTLLSLIFDGWVIGPRSFMIEIFIVPIVLTIILLEKAQVVFFCAVSVVATAFFYLYYEIAKITDPPVILGSAGQVLINLSIIFVVNPLIVVLLFWYSRAVYLSFKEQSQAHLELERRLLEIQKLEGLELLADGIAHDFNNTLTIIIGHLGLLRYGLEDGMGKADLEELVAEAENAVQRSRELPEQLLSFSKEGGLPIKQTASLVQLVEEVATFVLRGSGSKVLLETALPSDLWPVEFDHSQMGQVISNLVINAVQAMSEKEKDAGAGASGRRGGSRGKLTITAENEWYRGFTNTTLLSNNDHSRLHSKRPNSAGGPARLLSLPLAQGSYVKLSVSDTGAGIPPQIISRIFELYFTTKPTGSGVGLATSFSIVRKHGGLLTVDSLLGQGTTFTIYLPAKARPQAGAGAGDTEDFVTNSSKSAIAS